MALNLLLTEFTLKSVDIPYATHYSGQPIRIIVKMQRPLKNAAKCCQNCCSRLAFVDGKIHTFKHHNILNNIYVPTRSFFPIVKSRSIF